MLASTGATGSSRSRPTRRASRTASAMAAAYTPAWWPISIGSRRPAEARDRPCRQHPPGSRSRRPPGGATSAFPARLELADRQVPWHRDFPGLAASGGLRYRVRGWTMHDRTLQKATCAQGLPAVAAAFALPVVHFRRCRACIGAVVRRHTSSHSENSCHDRCTL